MHEDDEDSGNLLVGILNACTLALIFWAALWWLVTR